MFSFGDTGFYGSIGGQHLNAPVVGISQTREQRGYILVASDGEVFAIGDAASYGSPREASTTPAVSAPPGTLVPDSVGDVTSAALGAGASWTRRLAGRVEVDETYVGGEEPGMRGGRAKDKKSLVARRCVNPVRAEGMRGDAQILAEAPVPTYGSRPPSRFLSSIGRYCERISAIVAAQK